MHWKLPFYLYIIYFIAVFLSALITSKNVVVSFLAVLAVWIQFFGYGLGFLKSIFVLKVLQKNPEHYFPELFFNKND
jgi:hypothetical protein